MITSGADLSSMFEARKLKADTIRAKFIAVRILELLIQETRNTIVITKEKHEALNLYRDFLSSNSHRDINFVGENEKKVLLASGAEILEKINNSSNFLSRDNIKSNLFDRFQRVMSVVENNIGIDEDLRSLCESFISADEDLKKAYKSLDMVQDAIETSMNSSMRFLNQDIVRVLKNKSQRNLK